MSTTSANATETFNLILAIVNIVLFLFGIYTFYVYRDQPMIKFRSWTVNLAIVAAITTDQLTTSFTGLGIIDLETLKFLIYFKALLGTFGLSGFGFKIIISEPTINF